MKTFLSKHTVRIMCLIHRQVMFMTLVTTIISKQLF